MRIGLLHPGEMGSALGGELRARGHEVLWASAGRSADTARRAERAGLADAGETAALVRDSEVILSICPPHAAVDVAHEIGPFAGTYVDANAVSPHTARRIAELAAAGGAQFVDGGIVGGPPAPGAPTRLYLAGPRAQDVAELFEGTNVVARGVPGEIGAASALKMTYAAWSKGTAALVLAIRAVARAEGVEAELLREWADSLPDLPEQSLGAARAAATKGWRWVAEMEEIAATFDAAGLPGGFHRAAAEVFRRSPRIREAAADAATAEAILGSLSVDGHRELEAAGFDPGLDQPAHPAHERP